MEPTSGADRGSSDALAPAAGSTCLYCGTAFDTLPALLTHERSCPLHEEPVPTASAPPWHTPPAPTPQPAAVAPPRPAGPRTLRTRLAASVRAVRAVRRGLELVLRATLALVRQLWADGTASWRGPGGSWLRHGAGAGVALSVLVLLAMTVLDRSG